MDPRARALAGREAWGEERDVQKHQVRGCLLYTSQRRHHASGAGNGFRERHPGYRGQ